MEVRGIIKAIEATSSGCSSRSCGRYSRRWRSVAYPVGPMPDWLEGVGQVGGEVLVPGRAVRANITVDEALLRRIDVAAQVTGNTRSGFLAEAAGQWLRVHQRTWGERRARDLQRQLELFRAGKMRSFENTGSGDVETTAANIARIEGWLAELEGFQSLATQDSSDNHDEPR